MWDFSLLIFVVAGVFMTIRTNRRSPGKKPSWMTLQPRMTVNLLVFLTWPLWVLTFGLNDAVNYSAQDRYVVVFPGRSETFAQFDDAVSYCRQVAAEPITAENLWTMVRLDLGIRVTVPFSDTATDIVYEVDSEGRVSNFTSEMRRAARGLH